jgi:hypothetical protein
MTWSFSSEVGGPSSQAYVSLWLSSAESVSAAFTFTLKSFSGCSYLMPVNVYTTDKYRRELKACSGCLFLSLGSHPSNK